MNDSELVQIADILPPTAPVSTSFDSGFYFFLIIVIIAAAALCYLRSSKQKLKKLRKQYQQGKIDSRQCARQLASLLPQKENTVTSLTQENSRDWQQYASALQVARYSRQSLNTEAMSKLLRDTERWL